MLVVIGTMLTILMASGCVEDREQTNDAVGNFESLWRTIDTHYCFFEEKGIDWDSIYRLYRPLVSDETNMLELFSICGAMLNELKDGHVNLSSSFNTTYYRDWWTDYPQDFRLRTIQENYLDFNYLQTSGISYKMLLPDTIGYMYYPSFSYDIGNLNLDYILAILYESKGLIIDIRDNGGGNLTNIKTLVSRLIDKEVSGGTIRHKTGPGHNEFSEPYEIIYEPCDADRVSYLNKPIAVLTNRSCYSAANDFVSVMKTLPNVSIIGARTGGGGGLPFNSEMPIGWSIRFSACPMTSADGETTEFGIDPSPGCEVHAPDSILIQGIDPILDFARQKIMKEAEES